MAENLTILLDGSEETQIAEFIDECNKSKDIKKVSIIATKLRLKVQELKE